MKPFRVFVTGTDTGVGKTQVSCALLSLLADAGLSPAPFKPYESGCADVRRPDDAEAMRKAAQSTDSLATVCPHRLRLPLAPKIAASRLGQTLSFSKTLAAFRSFDGRALVAEGAGGLFVPLDSRREVIDLILELELPVLLVARAGLGTLNHVALSLEALRRRRIEVLAVVLSKGTAQKDVSVRDNAAVIAHRHEIAVLGPVPYERLAARRHSLFRQALKGWLKGQLKQHT